MEERMIQAGEFYRHFKDKSYQIIAIAIHSETREKMVVYQALYGNYNVYVRPYDMFVSEVDHVKYPEVKQKYRFEKVTFTSDGTIVSLEESQKDSLLPGNAQKSSTSITNQNQINDVTFNSSKVISNSLSKQKEQLDSDEAEANPLLLSFLELDTYEGKLDAFIAMRDKLDDKLLDDIAAVLDIAVDEGSIKQRYESIKNCLITFVRFEDNRLR